MAAVFSNNRDAWGALFFTSVVNPPEPAEIPIQRQYKRKEGKEPATIIREDFNWDGEDDVWLRLANAVIIQAKIDRQEALQRLQENPEDEGAKALLEDAEAFFLSEDYLMFTHYDGKTLLNRLRREQANTS
jgi:hypothetical protein